MRCADVHVFGRRPLLRLLELRSFSPDSSAVLGHRRPSRCTSSERGGRSLLFVAFKTTDDLENTGLEEVLGTNAIAAQVSKAEESDLDRAFAIFLPVDRSNHLGRELCYRLG